MKLLLDTHVFLWWLVDNPRLDKQTRAVIAKPTTQVFVSSASTWEIAIKVGIGKLKLPKKHQATLAKLPEDCGFQPLPILHTHAAEVLNLPPHHADPFDRILVGQARVEDLVLVTADEQLERYDVKMRRARA